MAAITGLRAVLPHFINRDLRGGPFLFTLTDIHQSNIYVDKEWRIKYLIDLEWGCTLPMEMQNPPHWLTSQGVDHLTGENFTEYNQVREEFMEAFEHEEKQQNKGKPYTVEKDDLPRSRTMRRVWESGGFFYFHALDSTTGLFNLWGRNIQPRFSNISNLNSECSKPKPRSLYHDPQTVRKHSISPVLRHYDLLLPIFASHVGRPSLLLS